MTTRVLFVYGTLKRGLRNNDLLAGQQFEGVAQTSPQFRLYDCGPYPCMVEDLQRGVAVRGEIWRVDETILARLDEFEDVLRLFVRREIDVPGISTPVLAYLFKGDVSGMRDCGNCWPKFS